MQGYKDFMINGKLKGYPVFEEGDRVKIPKNETTAAEDVFGTVQSTDAGGLFVNVKWDKEKYPSLFGGTVKIGSGRMCNGLDIVTQ